tara:strand:+ start:328 stop:537 length:210 start_codon:yes stop_codon:yes gene_type:complete
MNIEPELNPPWVYEPQEDKPRFDKYQIEHWLGPDNHKLENAIEIITEIANEQYTVKALIEDLEQMFPED